MADLINLAEFSVDLRHARNGGVTRKGWFLSTAALENIAEVMEAPMPLPKPLPPVAIRRAVEAANRRAVTEELSIGFQDWLRAHDMTFGDLVITFIAWFGCGWAIGRMWWG